jgi:hypothetical protein
MARDPETITHHAALTRPVERGRERRRRLRKERTARRAQARAQQAEDQARRAAAREVARDHALLPPGGDTGNAALRSYRRFRVPAHQDTSAALRGTYPGIAEGGLGSRGVFVGHDMLSGGAFAYDPWVLYRDGVITAPNLIVAGIVGSGKSALAKALATRSIAFGRKVYVAGDPKGEFTPVAEAVGGRAIVLGHGLPARLNPLDAGHRPSNASDAEWAATVAARRRDLLGALAETVLSRPLGPLEHTAIDIALATIATRTASPILPQVVDLILDPEGGRDPRLAEDGRQVGHALRRLVAGDLQGLFDGPSTEVFDPDLPMLTLDLSRVAENASLLSILMTCASAWMESALLDPAGGQRWVFYDEAWRVMSHPALLRRMDAAWRLARHYGIANALIFHKISDLDTVGDQGTALHALASSLLANAETRVIFRQESDQLGPTAKALGLTSTEQSMLPTLGLGQALWRIKDHSMLVQSQLHPEEARLFDTTLAMSRVAENGPRP